MSEENMHWADQMAKEVKERVERDPKLKKVVDENGYIVYDEKTPSGAIHIGSGRGWIIHDVIAKAMRDAGLKAKFVLSSDDIDPYDKPNKDLPDSFDKYLGMPFRNIPSPVEGYKSFADYFFMQCVEKFEEIGIDAEIESTGERYESGSFNKAIKTVLDNSDKIKDIFERTYSKTYDKIPFNVICEKCGKIATTHATKWDKEKELITYKCEKNYVDWTEGCGHEGQISPYDGNGKLPWKVEWASKWPSIGVVCEFAGKDHFTAGGSRTVSIAIADEVLDFPPPYPSTRKETGKGYEFFNVGGKKMSTSKGRGFGFAEIFNYVPAQIIRYLLVKTRPHAVLDFDPEGRNDMILLYERYDKAERIYFGEEKEENEHEIANQKRIYELSHIGDIPDRMPKQIPFTFAATVIQIGMNEEGALDILKKTGHVDENIKGMDLHYVLQRLRDAKKWVEKFAPEQYKFTLQENVPSDLEISDKEKGVLKKVAAVLSGDLSEEDLHNKFWEICQENDVKPKEFFKAAYKVLINKDRGPKLAGFMLSVGKEKVKKLFESV